MIASLNAYDGSTASQQKLIGMLQTRYQMELQYLQMIDIAAKTINDSLNQDKESIMLSQKDPKGKYDYYKEQADKLAKDLRTMTDPQQINDTVKKIEQYEQAAWGLLTPEQQKKMANQFIDFLQGIQDEANQQLGAAKQNAGDDATSLAQAVNDALTKAAAAQQAAADTQNAVADTFKQAVHGFAVTPIQVVITAPPGMSADVGGLRP